MPILLAKDTQNILKAYNEFFQRRPFPRKITLDDLEFLSNLTDIRSIKLENGEYAQFGLRNYTVIYDKENNAQITPDIDSKTNILTRKKISENKKNKEECNIKDFIAKIILIFLLIHFQSQ